MSEFHGEDLTGSIFHDVDLTNSRFELVDLTGVSIRSARLTNARFSNVDMVNVAISGEIEGLRVNEVDITPLVEAALNQRYPERVHMRPEDAEGFRHAWRVLERLWVGTVERARAMDPPALHQQVDGEWSFIETLRHLVFATDAWVRRAMLGDPSPWDALDLPHDEMPDEASVPRDRLARPSLEDVLALRVDRMATVRGVIEELTDGDLDGRTAPVGAPGYPESESFAVRRCLQAVVSEEWQHRLYAERDLDALEPRPSCYTPNGSGPPGGVGAGESGFPVVLAHNWHNSDLT
jgi:hypothetical protein